MSSRLRFKQGLTTKRVRRILTMSETKDLRDYTSYTQEPSCISCIYTYICLTMRLDESFWKKFLYDV